MNYVTLLPRQSACAATPLTRESAEQARALAARLASLTATVAKRHGAQLLDAATLSADHDPCSPVPWANGFPHAGGPSVPYHPLLAGMTALAAALDYKLDHDAPGKGEGRTS